MPEFQPSRSTGVRYVFYVFAIALLCMGFFLLALANFDPHINRAAGTMFGTFACFFLAMGAGLVGLARRLPTTEIMLLARQRNGLLTLSEVVITFNLSPDRALRALKKLQKVGIASPRWQEIRKNIWEFPDYMDLPMDQSIELAQHQGGRVSVQDLVAGGHSDQTARQTLNALSETGMAQPDPAAPDSSVLLAAQ